MISLALDHQYVFVLTVGVPEVCQLVDVLGEGDHLILGAVDCLILPPIQVG